jgi:hypothetical protein
MKTNKIILASLMAVGMLFAACTEEAPVREPSPADNTSIVAYFSSDNTTTLEVEPTASFPVVIARDNVADAATFELTYKESVEGAFTFNPTVSFAAGASTATINVTLNPVVKAGEAATLTLTIPASAATYYNNISVPVLDFNVTAGYLWVSAGTAIFQSGICSVGFGETMAAEVEVQKASDFVNEDGDKLYRLVSPYYYVSQGILCTQPGSHISFILDKDNQAKELLLVEGDMNMVFDSNALSGIQYIYWDLVDYGKYNVFFNQDDIYVIQALFSDGSGLYGPYQELFQFTPAE